MPYKPAAYKYSLLKKGKEHTSSLHNDWISPQTPLGISLPSSVPTLLRGRKSVTTKAKRIDTFMEVDYTQNKD